MEWWEPSTQRNSSRPSLSSKIRWTCYWISMWVLNIGCSDWCLHLLLTPVPYIICNLTSCDPVDFLKDHLWQTFVDCFPPLFQVNANELTNGVINAAFMLLFKDAIRLFAAYNEGIINLLGKNKLLFCHSLANWLTEQFLIIVLIIEGGTTDDEDSGRGWEIELITARPSIMQLLKTLHSVLKALDR